MKLTREDIQKYGTADEKKILLESATRKATTKIDMQFKDGNTLPAGTSGILKPVNPGDLPVEWLEKNPNRHYTTLVSFQPNGSEVKYKIKMRNLPRFFKGFKTPSVETMEKWEWEKGGCKTPVGTMVEPDGVDPDGWPSWMLILGIL
jgi:hypothetical protein